MLWLTYSFCYGDPTILHYFCLPVISYCSFYVIGNMLDMFGGTCIAIGNGIISINALLAILSKHHCTEMQSIENLTELPSLTYNLDIDII